MPLKPTQTEGVFLCKAGERSFTDAVRPDGSAAGSADIFTAPNSKMRGAFWTRESELPSGPFAAQSDEIFVVLEGRMDLELCDTGEVLVCEPGDVVFHEKGVRVQGFIRERPFLKFGVTVTE